METDMKIDLYKLYTLSEASGFLKLSSSTIKYYIDKKDIRIVETELGIKIRGTEIVKFKQHVH